MSSINDLIAVQDRIDDRLAQMATSFLKLYLDWQAPGIFARIMRRPRVVTCEAFMDMLDDAVDEGQLTWDDFEALRLTDLVLTGQRPADRVEIFVLVERAIERARVLEKLGRPVVPAVAGDRIDEEAATLAHDLGVWCALGRCLTAPRGA